MFNDDDRNLSSNPDYAFDLSFNLDPTSARTACSQFNTSSTFILLLYP